MEKMQQLKQPVYRYNRLLGNRNLGEEIINIISSDIENTCERIESRGLIFVLTLILLFPITLMEIIYCCWTYFFDTEDVPYTSISSIFKEECTTPKGICEKSAEQLNYEFTEVEKFEKVDNTYMKSKKKQKEREKALIDMRDILFLTNFTLRGYVIKTVQRKVSDEILEEDARTGNVSRPYWTEYIDFGESINNNLKLILPNKISLKKIKELPYKCLEIHNGDIFSVIEDLRNIFLQDDINIVFDTQENNLYNK